MGFVFHVWCVLVYVLGQLIWVLGVVFGALGVVFSLFFLSFSFSLSLGGIEGVRCIAGGRVWLGQSSGVGGVRFGDHTVGVCLRMVVWY